MKLWTFEHFITIIPTFIVMVIIAFILNRFLGKKSLKIRMIPFQIVAVILFLSEIGKQIDAFLEPGGYRLYALPFHVCSLFIFLIPLMAFYKGKYKDKINTITCTVCISLFLFMILYPNLIYSSNNIRNFFNTYDDFHTVFFHNLVLFEFILIIALNLHTPEKESYLKEVFIFGLSYAVVAATMAQLLKTNFSNFYSCNIGPLETLINSIKDSIGYFAGQAIYVAVLVILHVAFFIGAYYLYKLVNILTINLEKN